MNECTGHNGEVWRVEWNITGTMLATSADDGKVQLWQRHFKVRHKMGKYKFVFLYENLTFYIF